jgi:hypothetical protein
MRFQYHIRQLTAKELPVCLLIQGMQMVGAAKSLTPDGIPDTKQMTASDRKYRATYKTLAVCPLLAIID